MLLCWAGLSADQPPAVIDTGRTNEYYTSKEWRAEAHMASQFRKRDILTGAEFEEAPGITSCEDCFWSFLYSAPFYCALTGSGPKRRFRQCQPARYRLKRISPPSRQRTGSKPHRQGEFYSLAVRRLDCGTISKSNLGHPSSSVLWAAPRCPIARGT